MIRIEDRDRCFNYRVAGVAIRDDSVLLHQAEGESFWTLPSGRPEFGETAEQTLRREMLEETGIEVEVVRLLWFVENLFDYANKRYHEISGFFLMTLPSQCEYIVEAGPFDGEEPEAQVKLTFRWFPRRQDVLVNLPLLPSFLQAAIQALTESVEHVVQQDNPVQS